MKYNTRREARAAAESLVKSLHCKHLHTLAGALVDALSIAETLEKAALLDKSQETVGAAQEAHNSLIYWLSKCEGTISDLKQSPITHSDGEVHVFGHSLTPAQAFVLAERIKAHAEWANVRVQRAVELARPAIQGKQIVSIQ
jgi:hypothetical protein